MSSRDESPKRRAEIRQCPGRGETDVRRQNLANRIFEVLEPTEFAWVQNDWQAELCVEVVLEPTEFAEVQNMKGGGSWWIKVLEPTEFAWVQNTPVQFLKHFVFWLPIGLHGCKTTLLLVFDVLEPYGFTRIQNGRSRHVAYGSVLEPYDMM